MENNTGGKRVAPAGGMPKGAKIAIIAGAILLALLIGGYAGLCAYASAGGRIFSNTTTSIGVDLSGMTRQEAVDALRAYEAEHYRNGLHVSFQSFSADIGASGASMASVNAESVADAALARGRENGVLGMGLGWLSAQFNPVALDVRPQPSEDLAALSASMAEDITASLGSTLTQTSYRISGSSLMLTKGSSGLSVSAADVEQALLDAVLAGEARVELPLTPEITTPDEPDFEAILREIYVEPADAYLDKETKEIVPSVTGVSFDVAAARALLERADEKETCSVPLDLKEPAVTTEKLEENLFKDVLGESTTKAAGPNSRWFNIGLAAGFVDGTILLPGETFSYNEHCGPYEAATGYQKAGAYKGGKTVDTTAGGICQLSSTLYWTTLKANLETVERTKHKYDVGYLPTGMDATVFDDILDFKFKNSTDYPIKIECSLDQNHRLHVTIYGTNTTGHRGDPYAILLKTIPGRYLYEPSDTIAQGAEPQKDKERTLYNGKKVEVHQKVVDADGNVVSDTVIHTDTYSSRDGVYLYNPADAALWGIDPATGERNLTPVAPTPSADPSAVPTPDPAAGPDPNASPAPGADPATPTPPASEPPAVSQEPAPSPELPDIGIPIITDPPQAEPTPEAVPTPPPAETPPAAESAPAAEETPWPL